MSDIDSLYQKGLEAKNENNFQIAVKIFSKTFAMGKQESLMELGYIYTFKIPNAEKAITFYMKSIMNNFMQGESYYRIGRIYYCGLKDFPKDYEKALRYFEGAPENRNCLYMRGKMYLEGKGTKKDPKNAYKLFKKAANLGNLKSIGVVAKLYAKGIGVEKSKRKSKKWKELFEQRKNEEKELPPRQSPSYEGCATVINDTKKTVNENSLMVGTVVWIRVPGYPWWPACVVNPSTNDFPNPEKKTFLAKFFNDETYWWFNLNEKDSVKLYNKNEPELNELHFDVFHKDESLIEAIRQAREYYQENEKMFVKQSPKIEQKPLRVQENKNENIIPQKNFTSTPNSGRRIPKRSTPVPTVEIDPNISQNEQNRVQPKILEPAPPFDWRRFGTWHKKYFIVKWGEIIPDENFHSEQFIYPVGFVSITQTYMGKFCLEVLYEQQRNDPVFYMKKISDDGKFVEKECKSTSISKAWRMVTDTPKEKKVPNLRRDFGFGDYILGTLSNATNYCKGNFNVREIVRRKELKERKEREQTERLEREKREKEKREREEIERKERERLEKEKKERREKREREKRRRKKREMEKREREKRKRRKRRGPTVERLGPRIEKKRKKRSRDDRSKKRDKVKENEKRKKTKPKVEKKMENNQKKEPILEKKIIEKNDKPRNRERDQNDKPRIRERDRDDGVNITSKYPPNSHPPIQNQVNQQPVRSNIYHSSPPVRKLAPIPPQENNFNGNDRFRNDRYKGNVYVQPKQNPSSNIRQNNYYNTTKIQDPRLQIPIIRPVEPPKFKPVYNTNFLQNSNIHLQNKKIPQHNPQLMSGLNYGYNQNVGPSKPIVRKPVAQNNREIREIDYYRDYPKQPNQNQQQRSSGRMNFRGRNLNSSGNKFQEKSSFQRNNQNNNQNRSRQNEQFKARSTKRSSPHVPQIGRYNNKNDLSHSMNGYQQNRRDRLYQDGGYNTKKRKFDEFNGGHDGYGVGKNEKSRKSRKRY